VTSRLKTAGAVLLGKLNLDEMAFAGTGTTGCFGPAHIPGTWTESPVVPRPGPPLPLQPDFASDQSVATTEARSAFPPHTAV
jgi:hypothetical protein